MANLVPFFGFLVFFCVSSVGAKELPEKFLGTWKVAESENFEEYLVAKGYNWFMRALIRASPVSKIYEKNGNGTYTCKIWTPTKSVEWPNWKLGVPIVGFYLDDEKHGITFDYDPKSDVFSEKHVNLERQVPDETCIYTIDAGRLVMNIEFNGVKSRRFYTKESK